MRLARAVYTLVDRCGHRSYGCAYSPSFCATSVWSLSLPCVFVDHSVCIIDDAPFFQMKMRVICGCVLAMATDDGGASVGGASVAGGGKGQGACGSIERRRGRGRRENGVEKPDSLSLSLALHVVLLTLHSISPRPSVAGRQYPIDGNLLTPLCSNLPRLLIHLDIYTCLQSELSQFQCLPVVRFRTQSRASFCVVNKVGVPRKKRFPLCHRRLLSS